MPPLTSHVSDRTDGTDWTIDVAPAPPSPQVAADESGFGRFVRKLIHFRRKHPELRRR